MRDAGGRDDAVIAAEMLSTKSTRITKKDKGRFFFVFSAFFVVKDGC